MPQRTKIFSNNLKNPLGDADITLASGVDILPEGSGSSSLGSPSQPFNYVYAEEIVDASGSSIYVEKAGSTMTGDLTLSSGTDIALAISGTSDIGTQASPLQSVYANQINGVTIPTEVYNEIPAGTFDGTNTLFYLTGEPYNSSLMLFANGIHQGPGSGYDYTNAGSVIAFNVAPVSGTQLFATYKYNTLARSIDANTTGLWWHYLCSPENSLDDATTNSNDLTGTPPSYSSAIRYQGAYSAYGWPTCCLTMPAGVYSQFNSGADATIEAYVYVSSLSARKILWTYYGAIPSDAWGVTIETDGSLSLWLDGTEYTGAAGKIITDTWYHVAMVVGTNNYLYVSPANTISLTPYLTGGSETMGTCGGIQIARWAPTGSPNAPDTYMDAMCVSNIARTSFPTAP